MNPAHILIAVLTALLSCPVFAADAASASAKPPNIIFILADDLGYGDLGCYGQKHIKTPNLDRMAAEGLRFTQFYAGSTVCTPSRCVLMTGQNIGQAHLRGNVNDDLRPQDVTVAEVMKEAGYRTGLIGKWGLGHPGSPGVPHKQGFDSFYGYLENKHAHNYYPEFLWRDDEQKVPLKNVVPNAGAFGQGVATEKVQYTHDLLADEVLAFLDKQKGSDKPFFLYFTPTIPHANNEAKDKGMEVPELGEYASTDWPEPQKGHAAMITRLDRDIGRMFQKLKDLGMDENTVVFFSSDNGPHNEGGQKAALSNSSGPLRGTKRDLTEGGIRVPMLARWPGVIPAGKTSDHIGGFQDVMVTLAELGNAKPAADHDGVSFAATLRGKPDEQKRHEYMYWEFYEGKGARAVRMGDWKAIYKPAVGGTWEVYDLAKDLGEQNNVAAQQAEVIAKAKAIMNTAHQPAGKWMLPAIE